MPAINQSSLDDHGIRLARPRIGWQGTACPECARVKCRSHDGSLGVELFDDGGARWSCQRCGWKGSTRGDSDQRAPDKLRLRPPEPEPRPSGLSAAAARTWRDCRPLTTGSPAAAYLRSRGCPLPPNDVRWHPALPHKSGHTGPCLVARVTDAVTAEPINLHRTWLKADGSGKAALEPPRLLFKGHRKAGGVVRLWPDEEVTQGLCVAEGIETALSAAVGFGLAWACIDAGNLAALPVLEGVEALTIVADHDEVNPKTGRKPGLAAAEACASQWVEAGREVRLWHAPTEGTDFNDFVREAAA